MRSAPRMRWLALLLAVLLPLVAAAQETSTRTWILESGQSRVVEVGPYQSYLVVDPNRIQVETAGAEALSVTALRDGGAAVMYVFTESGPRTHVFYVRQPTEPKVAADAERRWGSGPGIHPEQDFSYTAYGALSGDGSTVVAGTTHDLWLSQVYDDAALQGWLSIAGREGVGWNIPHVRIQGRRGDSTLAAGDETLTLATGVASMAARGVSFTWSPDADRTYLGALVGVGRPASCCAFLEAGAPTLAVVRGGIGTSRGVYADGAAGVIRDPDLDGILPLARAGLGFRQGQSQASAEVFRLGRGSGGTADLFLSGGRWTLVSGARLTTRDAYLGQHILQSADAFQGWIGPSLRLGDRWAVSAAGSFGRSSVPGGWAQMSAVGQIGASVRPADRHTLRLAYRALAGWSRDEGNWEGIGGSHQGELITTHATPRGHHFENWLRVTFDADGFEALQLTHHTEVRAAEVWQWGVLASGGVQRGGTGQVHLAAEVTREVRRLYFEARLGSVVGFGGPDGVTAGPVAGGVLAWQPVEAHRFGLDASTSYQTTTKRALWRMLASYTFTRGLVRRPDARAAGIAGSIRGVVFEDLDWDGVHDPEEPGVPGIRVQLDGGRSTVSDAQGGFRMGAVVPGAHELSIDRDGWHTVDGTHHPVQVRPLRAAPASFALSTGRRILVRVFVDRDGNGMFSNGDRGVPAEAVTVRDADGEVVHTGPVLDGLADLTGLKAGIYTVSLDSSGLPAGYVGEAESEQSVDLERARHVVVHFPVRPLRNIGGTVFLDMPFNGNLTDRDQPAANVVVTLSDGQQRLTDANGRFLFRDLAEGTFEVRVVGARSPVVRLPDAPTDVLDLRILISDHSAIERALAGDPLVPEESPGAEDRGFGLPEPPAVVETTAPELEGIRLDPAALFLTPGQSATLTPIGRWSNDEQARLEDTVSWNSSNPGVASVDADGRVTGQKFGFAEIGAERSGIASPPVLVEVTDLPLVGLQLDTPLLRINPGETRALTATGLFVDGRIAELSHDVRWRSEDEAVAEVSPDGRVRAVGRGETRVFADFWGMTAFPTTVVVAPPPSALIAVSMPAALLVGSDARVKALADYGDGTRVDVTSFVEWTSNHPGVLAVGRDGVLTGIAPGSVVVAARWQGVTSGPATVEVVAGPVVGLQVVPDAPVVHAGEAVPLRCVATVAEGRTVDLTGQVRWSAADETVATVDENGLLTGVGHGKTELEAQWTGADGHLVTIAARVRVK